MSDTVFFERLLFLCSERHKEVSNVLKELGLSTSKGTAWRNGSIPNGEILVMLANYFETSTDYLLGTTDDPQQKTPPTNEVDGGKVLTKDNINELLDEMSVDELISLAADVMDKVKERKGQ